MLLGALETPITESALIDRQVTWTRPFDILPNRFSSSLRRFVLPLLLEAKLLPSIQTYSYQSLMQHATATTRRKSELARSSPKRKDAIQQLRALQQTLRTLSPEVEMPYRRSYLMHQAEEEGSTPFPRTLGLRVSPPAAESPVSDAGGDCASVRCSQRDPLVLRPSSGIAGGSPARV